MPDDTQQLQLILSQMYADIDSIANRSSQDLTTANQQGRLTNEQVAAWLNQITQLRTAEDTLSAAGIVARLEGHGAELAALQGGTAQLTAALKQIQAIERAVQFYAIWIPAVAAIATSLSKGDIQGAFKSYNDASDAWQKATAPPASGTSANAVSAQSAPPLTNRSSTKAAISAESDDRSNVYITININVGQRELAQEHLVIGPGTQPSEIALNRVSVPSSPLPSLRLVLPNANSFPGVCVDVDLSKVGSKANLAAMGHAIRTNIANAPNIDHPQAANVIDYALNDRFDSMPLHLVGLANYMALITGKRWSPGQQLLIGFLNGSDTQKQRVVSHAQEWLSYANIKFDVSGSDQGQIRISFGPDPGSWSTIGTDCMAVPNNEATMNFGWLYDETDDTEYNRVVVHEFGHALGCIHEHQNPAGGINWNKPAVYAYYEGPPNNWSPADVDANIFNTYDKDITNYTVVDPNSIMMYPIPAGFTTDGFAVGWNSDLSATDKTFMAQNYPATTTGAQAGSM